MPRSEHVAVAKRNVETKLFLAYDDAMMDDETCWGHSAIEKFTLQNSRVNGHFCGVSLAHTTLHISNESHEPRHEQRRNAGMHPQHTTALHQEVSFAHWRVWKTVKALERDGMTSTMPNPCYDETTRQVVSILRQWGTQWAGQPDWQSLLNKPSLQHETEESIVALHHLHQWLLQRHNKEEPLIVVDVCCGKGLFSMLLSYLMGSVWRSVANISRIVMLDKMTSKECGFSHVHIANETAAQENRPIMELWEGCNLHEYDAVLSRMLDLNSVLALTGIHLCKTLSPSCVGLVNGLGTRRCPYLLLAPCCMPRLVTTKTSKRRCIPVNVYETDQERQDRLNAMKKRDEALRRSKSRNGECYLCAEQHRVRDCPQLPTNEEERVAAIQKALATVPCWKCGVLGHFKVDCTSDSKRPPAVNPPFVTINVDGLLDQPQPLDTYCHLIADTVQDAYSKQVIETGLTNATPHQERNWNSGRKSIYIVICR